MTVPKPERPSGEQNSSGGEHCWSRLLSGEQGYQSD
jgi:hypothetical protein